MSALRIVFSTAEKSKNPNLNKEKPLLKIFLQFPMLTLVTFV